MIGNLQKISQYNIVIGNLQKISHCNIVFLKHELLCGCQVATLIWVYSTYINDVTIINKFFIRSLVVVLFNDFENIYICREKLTSMAGNDYDFIKHITLAVHFEASQMWEQLKQFFTTSSLWGKYIHIKKRKEKKERNNRRI